MESAMKPVIAAIENKKSVITTSISVSNVSQGVPYKVDIAVISPIWKPEIHS